MPRPLAIPIHAPRNQLITDVGGAAHNAATAKTERIKPVLHRRDCLIFNKWTDKQYRCSSCLVILTRQCREQADERGAKFRILKSIFRSHSREELKSYGMKKHDMDHEGIQRIEVRSCWTPLECYQQLFGLEGLRKSRDVVGHNRLNVFLLPHFHCDFERGSIREY
ncbi:hypothetical protein M513_12965 [Trichuris suis]|uniref:Uncharacterized protein n=1 Tax=Trichuris suis TaxID=68888 RepID=A0A085LMG1_9BILA|nr:hypothetical protein M513_12965 [Trichuris suis]